MNKKKKIGLSLSGGGFRATAYHLGTLKKLNEMGILKDVDVISSISGGSITNAIYGLYGSDFKDFENRLLKGVRSNVVKGILSSTRFLLIAFAVLILLVAIIGLLFTIYAWVSFLILIFVLIIFYKFQFALLPISKIIESLYNRFFFHKKVLGDLSKKPTFAINSTNLETGRQFTFSQNYMGDSTYVYREDGKGHIKFKSEAFPIARAVAASTCVPFAFTPISISKLFFKDINDFKKVQPKLVDGGIYDNQGIHKLTQRRSKFGCDIIITSDAGNKMSVQSKFGNTIKLLTRTSDLFMNRIKNLQIMKNVYENFQFEKREIAYQSLGWNIEKCVPAFINNLKNKIILDSVIKAHGITKEEIDGKKWEEIRKKIEKNIDYKRILSESPTKKELEIARSVKTSLKTLSEQQINSLIKQAYCLTELQVKLYCPSIVK